MKTYADTDSKALEEDALKKYYAGEYSEVRRTKMSFLR